MTDAKIEVPGKGQRDRSPSFPFIPLETAIERLTDFEAHHKRASVTADRIGPAWGMKAGSSQAQQTVAALKAYGLLESQRGPNGSEVSVSEEGRTYLRVQQDSIKRQVLERAAIKPKQIAIYWREWGADRPKDAACQDALVINGQFSPEGAGKFLTIYDATIAFAGLSDSDKIPPDSGLEADETSEADEINKGEKPPPLVSQTLSVAHIQKAKLMEGERELTTGLLSKGASFRLIVSGHIGEKEIERLIKKLELDKEILADDDGEDDEAAN